MTDEKTRLVAQVIVEPEAVTLCYVGEAQPQVIPHEKVKRIIVNLRDVDGPCAWVEEVGDEEDEG